MSDREPEVVGLLYGLGLAGLALALPFMTSEYNAFLALGQAGLAVAAIPFLKPWFGKWF